MIFCSKVAKHARVRKLQRTRQHYHGVEPGDDSLFLFVGSLSILGGELRPIHGSLDRLDMGRGQPVQNRETPLATFVQPEQSTRASQWEQRT